MKRRCRSQVRPYSLKIPPSSHPTPSLPSPICCHQKSTLRAKTRNIRYLPTFWKTTSKGTCCYLGSSRICLLSRICGLCSTDPWKLRISTKCAKLWNRTRLSNCSATSAIATATNFSARSFSEAAHFAPRTGRTIPTRLKALKTWCTKTKEFLSCSQLRHTACIRLFSSTNGAIWSRQLSVWSREFWITKTASAN